MATETLNFENADDVREVLGVGDQYLKRLYEILDINVVVRGDSMQISGDGDDLQRGREILEALQGVVQKSGRVEESKFSEILGEKASPQPEPGKPIDLFSKSKTIRPKSPGQAAYAKSIDNHDLVFCSGPAGSGKTYLAVAMALNALRRERVRKIVLVRPAVEAGEKLGFLPGDMIAKVNPYLRPLLDALRDMLDFETVQRYIAEDVIEILPLAFMRGRTLNDTFIILDEAQNTTQTQMKMFLTRMGVNSKIVVTGDSTQLDLPVGTVSGLNDAMKRLKNVKGIAMVKLEAEDIVRHRLVKEIVQAYDITEHPRPKRHSS